MSWETSGAMLCFIKACGICLVPASRGVVAGLCSSKLSLFGEATLGYRPSLAVP
jgi:hypothetical protein